MELLIAGLMHAAQIADQYKTGIVGLQQIGPGICMVDYKYGEDERVVSFEAACPVPVVPVANEWLLDS